jgi:hypothetical protein
MRIDNWFAYAIKRETRIGDVEIAATPRCREQEVAMTQDCPLTTEPQEKIAATPQKEESISLAALRHLNDEVEDELTRPAWTVTEDQRPADLYSRSLLIAIVIRDGRSF